MQFDRREDWRLNEPGNIEEEKQHLLCEDRQTPIS